MKKIVMCVLAVSFLMGGYLEARGGGRGGGGGGGGGRGFSGGGGRSMNRSPSMSRTSYSRPQARNYERPANAQARNYQRPANLDRGQFANQGSRPGQGQFANSPSRDQVKQFLNNKPGDRQQARDLGNRQDRLNNDLNNRKDWANNVRNDVNRYHPDNRNWFNNNFWNNHGWHPGYWNDHTNWWGVATAVGVAGWLGWNRTPYYYGYDDDWYYPSSSYSSQDSYSQGYSQGYTQGAQTASPQPAQPSYAESSQTIESAPSSDVASSDWMPLGVFALSKDGSTTATPNVYLQLALSKNGVISGTYYNSTTDQTYETEGAVDQSTERAAWKIANNENSPILETGIYNLTQDQAPVRVNFPDGRVQQMVLIRMQQQGS